MSAATRRCDRIISLIDECLAEADEVVRSTARPSGSTQPPASKPRSLPGLLIVLSLLP